MPSPTTDTPRGAIVPIGGAEAKTGTRDVLRRVLALAGGPDARIVVIPTASELPDTGDRYATLFKDLGAAEVRVLEIAERAQRAKIRIERHDFVRGRKAEDMIAARMARNLLRPGAKSLHCLIELRDFRRKSG